MNAPIPFVFCLILGLSGAGCSSSPYRWAETDLDSPAPGQAFAAAAMFPRRPMPDRRDVQRWEFYYKHCAIDESTHYYTGKAAAYDCTGPY